jgi:hypothetical protein
VGLFYLKYFSYLCGMKEELLNLIVLYSKGELSKENIIQAYGQMMMDLLEIYINDSNSSTLREAITCKVVGLESTGKKLGYDSKLTNEEVKPKNIKTGDKKKLDAHGNYSDLTHRRHKKYIEDNVIIHMSGFVNGFLIYIIKVSYRDLAPYFQNMLDKQLPNGDETNKYLRTAYFMFNVIKDMPSLEIEFLRNDFNEYKSFFQKDFFTYLQENQPQ